MCLTKSSNSGYLRLKSEQSAAGVIVLRKIKILKFNYLMEIRQKTFCISFTPCESAAHCLHFRHPHVSRDMMAAKAGGWPQTCGQTSGIPCQGKPGGPDDLDAKDHSRLSERARQDGPAETARHAQPGSFTLRSGQDMACKTGRPKATQMRTPTVYIPETSRICVCYPGQDKTCHGCIAPRERRSAS